MQIVIIIGAILLVLGLIKKIKRLITLGIIVAVVAFVLNYLGVLSIPVLPF